MARTTVKVAPTASRVLRKSAIVASLCAVMLVAGMLHPTYAYGDTLSDAQAALAAAQNELTAAKNELTLAEKALAEANSALDATQSALTAAQNNLNNSVNITNDMVFSGKTPLYVPVSGNTNKPANSTLVAVEGKYVDGTSDSTPRTQQQILDYINSVRQDAYNTKLADGSRVAASYTAVTWSKNLERTAQIRATEISIYGDHTRPSGEAWYGVSDEGLMATSAENLSWGSNYYGNIKMWADEKADYVKYLNCSKGKKTVNGVNQCNYGVYGHYRNLVNPSYNKIGLAQFNTNRSTTNPYGTAMAAEFSASGNAGSSAVKSLNATIYQGVYVKTAAMGSVGADGATTFNPTKVSGDPVWTRSAQVKEAKALAVSLGYKPAGNDTLQAAVTNAQNRVTAALNQIVTAQNNVNAAKTKVNTAQNKVNTAQNRFSSLNKTDWQRLWGNGAFDTMSAIASEAFSAKCDTVIISTSKGFLDALAANGVAGVYDAPILFTEPTKLTAQTKMQLTRLQPKRIMVTGGPYAVYDNVFDEIEDATGIRPVRYWGQTGADTANALANAGKGRWSKNAIVVTDRSYLDALSVGPYAYAKHAPIFYAHDGKSLSASTLDTMKSLGITKVYIIGGPYAVTPNVESQIAGRKMTSERIWGQSAINTSEAVAQFSLNQGMSVDKMGIATTNSYYDGLASGPLLGKNNSVLVLTDSKDFSAINNIYVKNKKTNIVRRAYIFGGKYAVSDSVLDYVKKQ